VECCFSKLKQFRRVATRFEKTARNYQAVVTLSAIVLWIASVGRGVGADVGEGGSRRVIFQLQIHGRAPAARRRTMRIRHILLWHVNRIGEDFSDK